VLHPRLIVQIKKELFNLYSLKVCMLLKTGHPQLAGLQDALQQRLLSADVG